jgi:hypothetical protein
LPGRVLTLHAEAAILEGHVRNRLWSDLSNFVVRRRLVVQGYSGRTSASISALGRKRTLGECLDWVEARDRPVTQRRMLLLAATAFSCRQHSRDCRLDRGKRISEGPTLP